MATAIAAASSDHQDRLQKRQAADVLVEEERQAEAERNSAVTAET
jgi:hypothetical protein